MMTRTQFLVALFVFSMFAQAQSTYTCAICEIVLYTAKGYLSESSTEQQIAAVLKKVCDYVPSNYTSVCGALVETYGPEIIKDLLDHQDPEQICESIQFCRVETSSPVSEKPSSPLVTEKQIIVPKTGKKTPKLTGNTLVGNEIPVK
eukprot:TRINITY_DN11778_c0_g1_i1.p1 TRINITY_DN11778_c0_g1~~TRINITY_DN11778_c0_g1_i1.p1  ORF type:complete len:147 (-),score=36.95 TRINITY_DN11778_c0_g1_i1:40-480(-)